MSLQERIFNLETKVKCLELTDKLQLDKISQLEGKLFDMEWSRLNTRRLVKRLVITSLILSYLILAPYLLSIPQHPVLLTVLLVDLAAPVSFFCVFKCIYWLYTWTLYGKYTI